MERINQIWSQQEATRTAFEYLMQKYSGEIGAELYIAYHVPVKKFCLILKGRHLRGVNVRQFAELQEIKVYLAKTSEDVDKMLIVIELYDSSNREIFSVLCADLIHSMPDSRDEKYVTDHIFRRLKTWKAIFESGMRGILSVEQQTGLYGELYVLRQLLQWHENKENVIFSWTGPDRDARDFQYMDWGIEVKTTVKSATNLVKISNKKQLDIRLTGKLYLYRIALERLNQTGDSLPAIVREIGKLLEDDTMAYDRFRYCLCQAGYSGTDEEEYGRYGYRLRDCELYDVHGSFPRIVETDLPEGVEEISYIINLAGAREYKVNEEAVLKNLTI